MFKSLSEMTPAEMRQEVDEIELAIKLVGRGCVKEEALAHLDVLRHCLIEGKA